LGLTDPQVARNFREQMRRSACGRFNTVLGPGSDGYHENHVHVDLQERSRGFRMCQWDVRDPEAHSVAGTAGAAADAPVPLPPPRPKIEDRPSRLRGAVR
jgi:hypothetical protein